jgi:hypothetical protein
LWQCGNIALKFIRLITLGGKVQAGRTVFVAFIKRILAEESLEKSFKKNSIFGISDSTSIVTLSDTVMECIEWNGIGVLLKENVKLLD